MSMKKCKHCAMEVPSEAKICPYCRKKQPTAFNTRKTFIVLGIFAFLAAMSSLNETPQKTATPEEIEHKKEFSDSIDAQVWAKQYIEPRLKAPATAKWQDSADVAVARIKGSKNKWLVNGYVDSQNSYGAMLRMKYWATMAKKKDGSWMLVDLKTQP